VQRREGEPEFLGQIERERLERPRFPSTAVCPEGRIGQRAAISAMSASSSRVSAKITPARATIARISL
jgi:hypothetical protein